MVDINSSKHDALEIHVPFCALLLSLSVHEHNVTYYFESLLLTPNSGSYVLCANSCILIDCSNCMNFVSMFGGSWS